MEAVLPYLLAATIIAAIWSRRSLDMTLGSESMLVKGYRAGVPFDLVVTKIDGVWMAKRAGEQFLAMKAAAARAGIVLHVNSGFRSMGEQEHLYAMTPEEREAHGIGQQVARPGYSNHQSGLALDISTSGSSAILPWLRENAHRFDFTNTVASEPWHWEVSHG